MASYLITGSSRGIGLALAALLACKPVSEVSKVFASARRESDALKKLIDESAGRVEFIQLDVASEQSAKQAARIVEKSLDDKGLDVVVNNAAIMNLTPNGIENMTDLEETFKVNVAGVHYVTSAFLPLLKRGSLKKVINISAIISSINKASASKHLHVPAYKISKAALNMLTVQYAQAFEDKDFTFVAIYPGWVKTDMGSEAADLTVEESVNGILDILSRVTVTETGQFFTVNVPGRGKNRHVTAGLFP
ncbi:short-chain dehydrogenase-like protein [Macrophomina phaseolina]|uniref:Short-chain dehydrogenase-like protein n=1 Tax=Macrophomina phaseolina TaxID=35725 RepID=A0ABQ8G5I2_9PEZI|nr:short-chain dehydrogenase-like protein [Macrophomina phaseolina]